MAVKKPSTKSLTNLKALFQVYDQKRKQLDIDPPGSFLFWYSRSNHTDDMHITVTSNGDGTYLIRKFTGPLIDTVGSGNQDEVDSKDNLDAETALQIAGQWQQELEDE